MKFIYTLIIILFWAYGIVNANTAWKYVPAIGAIVGAVCIVEDYSPSKIKK